MKRFLDKEHRLILSAALWTAAAAYILTIGLRQLASIQASPVVVVLLVMLPPIFAFLSLAWLFSRWYLRWPHRELRAVQSCLAGKPRGLPMAQFLLVTFVIVLPGTALLAWVKNTPRWNIVVIVGGWIWLAWRLWTQWRRRSIQRQGILNRSSVGSNTNAPHRAIDCVATAMNVPPEKILRSDTFGDPIGTFDEMDSTVDEITAYFLKAHGGATDNLVAMLPRIRTVGDLCDAWPCSNRKRESR